MLEIQCQPVLHSLHLRDARELWDQILCCRGQGFAGRVDGTFRILARKCFMFIEILLGIFYYIHTRSQSQRSCRI